MEVAARSDTLCHLELEVQQNDIQTLLNNNPVMMMRMIMAMMIMTIVMIMIMAMPNFLS